MTLQPGFQGLDHRLAGPLPVADRITEAAVWIGCHQQLTAPMIDWAVDGVTKYLLER